MTAFLRFLAATLCVLLTLTLLPAAAAGVENAQGSVGAPPPPLQPPPSTSAAAAALFDAVSGSFLALQNADARLPMASTTKVMTALVVLDRCSLSETVTVPKEAVGVEGSSIYLYEGEEITVNTLLYALLLSSANDAATALALHAADSIADFAVLMNQKAAALGLQNTHFANPHGLYAEDHYTSARDLALLMAAAMQNSQFAKITGTARYSVPQNGTDATRLFLNHNRLLRTLEGAVGGKTGFTKKSGRCLVSAAERDGLLLIAVTLNDGNDWRDHTALMEWGFLEYVAFTPTPDPLTLPVVGGEAGTVALVAAAQPTPITLPRRHGEITVTAELPRFLFAGVEADTAVGALVYVSDGQVIARVPLKTANAVPRVKARLGILERIQRIFTK